MPKYDLSDAADFNRLTAGTATNLASVIGENPNDWDLEEGSYGGIKFHVFKISNVIQDGLTNPFNKKVRYEGALSRITDNGGRRKVKYQFPYKDGQTTDDLGRRAFSFEMDIVIHGARYMEGFIALTEAFNKPGPQTLVHPIRGSVLCVVDDIQWVHSCEERKAVALRASFIEHNFVLGTIRKQDDDSIKSAFAKALQIFNAIDRVITKVEQTAALIRSVKNLIQSYLAIHKSTSAVYLQKANGAFNSKGGNNGIPALVGFNLGGTGLGTDATGGPTDTSIFGNLSSEVATGKTVYSGAAIVSDQNFVVVRSVSDPFNGVPLEEISQEATAAVAVAELTKQSDILRAQIAAIIQAIEDNGAALDLNDSILDLRSSLILIQNVLRQGIASSNARLVSYTTPRLMSLREVTFANGINLERVEEIDLLNGQLDSTNFIPAGTVLRVPAS